jgi:hypothetical protein
MKARQPNSFSFSLPTPLLFEDMRPRLSKVFLLYKLDESARLSRLSVMDGPNELLHLQFAAEHRYLAVDAQSTVDAAGNSWSSWDLPELPEVHWGIGIGIIVDPLDGDSDVTFVSAGAEFVVGAEEPAAALAT